MDVSALSWTGRREREVVSLYCFGLRAADPQPLVDGRAKFLGNVLTERLM